MTRSFEQKGAGHIHTGNSFEKSSKKQIFRHFRPGIKWQNVEENISYADLNSTLFDIEYYDQFVNLTLNTERMGIT